MPDGRHVERSIGQILFHLEKAKRRYLEINTIPGLRDLHGDLISLTLACIEIEAAQSFALDLQGEFEHFLAPKP